MCFESMAGVCYAVHKEWLPHWEAELPQFTLVLFRQIINRVATFRIYGVYYEANCRYFFGK